MARGPQNCPRLARRRNSRLRSLTIIVGSVFIYLALSKECDCLGSKTKELQRKGESSIEAKTRIRSFRARTLAEGREDVPFNLLRVGVAQETMLR